MYLSNEAIKKFQDLYQEYFGLEIPEKEARERGEALVSLFEVIYKPIPKNYLHKDKNEYEVNQK